MEYDINRLREVPFFENQIRKVINIEKPRLLKLLKEFEGQQLLKVDSALLKKVKDKIIPNREIKITPLFKSHNAKINYFYLTNSEYNIYVHLSICFSGGNYEDKTNYCYYVDQSIYLCDLENGHIKKYYEHDPLKFLNVNKEIEVFKSAYNKREEYKKEKDKLFYLNRKLLEKYGGC